MATGSTPVKGRPYPLETDGPDVAADMHALALSLETAPVSTVGTLAARPSSGVSAGDRHVVSGDSTASNNGIEWFHTGSSWVALNPPPDVITTTAVNMTAVAGEGVWVTASGKTITLPTPVANTRVSVRHMASSGTATTISAGSALIFGLGCWGVSSIQCGALGATIRLVGDGTNWNVESGQQDTGWVVLSLSSGVASAGGTTPAYRVRGDEVQLRGGVTTSAGTLISTLPPVARPAAGLDFLVGGQFTVGSAGNLNAGTPGPTTVSLGGLVWSVL